MPDYPGVYKRGDVYVAAPYNPATQRKIHLGTRDLAEDAYLLVLAWQAGHKTPGRNTISEIRTEWLELHVKFLEPATEKDYRRDTLWLESRYGDQVADDLYDRFNDVQRAAIDQSSNAIANSFAMLEWARKRRMCKSNALEGVHGRPAKKREAKVILDEEGVEDLVSHCFKVHRDPIATRMASLIYLQYGTILRPAHLRGLRNRDIYFDTDRIWAPKVKRGRSQWVAMLSYARKGLELLPPGDPDDFVYQTVAGKPLAKSTLNNWFSPVRASFGRPDLWFYDLKTSGVRRLRHAGARPEDLAVQATHNDDGDTISKHYTELEAELALRAVAEADSVAVRMLEEKNSVANRSQSAREGA
jgi:integrase